tara:strand:- start:330 stop:581 length:252 start_codon:yes stop_codon:yes gene_type:complete
MLDFIKVKMALRKFRKIGVKPTINRTNASWMGYDVVKTKLFVRVYDGHKVLYFGNPFHNMYRIFSISGSLDYVTHSVAKRKAA